MLLPAALTLSRFGSCNKNALIAALPIAWWHFL